MKRRKFILGAGATAAGGASLLGSGAFTSVQAERSIAVDVASDENAFLRLAPCEGSPNSAYVTETAAETIAIDLSDSNDQIDGSGEGVNTDALSTFDSVFEICNQGTQDVCVDFEVDVPTIPDTADVPNGYDFGAGDPAVVFYRGGDREEVISADGPDTDRPGAISLSITDGECQCVGFEVRSFGFSSTEAVFDEAALTIRADAGGNCVDGISDGDSPEETIDTDPVAWYDATQLTLNDGDDVSAWPDRTGNDNNANQQRGDPTYVSAGIGGRPAVRFDGDGDGLLKSDFSAGDADEATIFVVARYDALPSANPGLIHAGEEDNAFSITPSDKSVGVWLSQDGDLWGRFVDSNGRQGFPEKPFVAEGAGFLVSQRADSERGECKQWLNGASAGTAGYNGELQGWSEFGIGRQANEPWAGVIAEVIVYDTALSDAERGDIESYLTAKYDINP